MNFPIHLNVEVNDGYRNRDLNIGKLAKSS